MRPPFLLLSIGSGHRTEIRPEPVRGLVPAGNFDRGASGSEAGCVRRRKTVTAACEGATESATRSCKPSSADGTGTDVTLFPRWTAPTTVAASATATYPTRLDRHGMFLLWEDRSYGDALPQLEGGISVPATRMVDRKDVGRICDDTTTSDDRPPAGGKRRLIREGGSASGVSDHVRPGIQEGEQCRLFPHDGQ